MISGANRWLALLCVLAVATPMALVWLKHRGEPKVTNSETCAVYRALYRHISKVGGRGVFRPISKPFVNDRYRLAPSEFWGETGKYKVEKITPGGEKFRRPVLEKFEIDTAGYFQPLQADRAFPIHDCFDGRSDKPEFYPGWADWIRARVNLVHIGAMNRVLPAIYDASPVGFSKDGRYALVYEEVNCSGLCGGGGFDLFEKRHGAWVWIGYSGVWVS